MALHRPQVGFFNSLLGVGVLNYEVARQYLPLIGFRIDI